MDKFIAKFKNKSSIVLKLTKKAIDHSYYSAVTKAISDTEKIYLDELMKTKDANEGIQAFLEKRVDSVVNSWQVYPCHKTDALGSP